LLPLCTLQSRFQGVNYFKYVEREITCFHKGLCFIGLYFYNGMPDAFPYPTMLNFDINLVFADVFFRLFIICCTYYQQ